MMFLTSTVWMIPLWIDLMCYYWKVCRINVIGVLIHVFEGCSCIGRLWYAMCQVIGYAFGFSFPEIYLRNYGSEVIEVSDDGSGVEPSNFEGLSRWKQKHLSLCNYLVCCPKICLPGCLPACPSIILSVYLSFSLSVCLTDQPTD